MKDHSDLAFEVAYSQLRAQKEDLRHARNQAGMAAAMTGLIATVFAGMTTPGMLKSSEAFVFLSLNIEFWLVLATFFGSLYFAAMVSTAQRVCNFDLNAPWILKCGFEGKALNVLKRELAKDCDKYFDENEIVISEARQNLWWSITLGCSQVPAWILIIT